VSVSGEYLPRPWAERYPTLDVPGELSIGGCRPGALRLVTMPDGQDLIQLGELPYGALCLDPFDGRIVDIVADRAGDVVRGPQLVNSSLRQYVVTVDRATARFPYDDGQEDADFDVVADDLRADLAPIDPPAWYGDGYWDTFYWDVTIGDYHSILFGRPEP
jgi:SUKH-4 immunity protein